MCSMNNIELSDSEISLLIEILKTDVGASMNLLKMEKNQDHARALADRIIMCNNLLGGLSK